MSNVEILWASAPSLDKLSRELSRLLADRDASDIISVSHNSGTVATDPTGGLWGPRRFHHRAQHSAIVVLRA